MSDADVITRLAGALHLRQCPRGCAEGATEEDFADAKVTIEFLTKDDWASEEWLAALNSERRHLREANEEIDRLVHIEFLHGGCAMLREKDNQVLIDQRDRALREVEALCAELRARGLQHVVDRAFRSAAATELTQMAQEDGLIQ